MTYYIKLLDSKIKEGKITYCVESRDSWTTRQKSRFIESLLMGLPVLNDIVFLRERDECLTILHGNRRIRAIQEYVNNKYQLEGLDAMKNLNGKSFEDLKDSFAVYQTQLMDYYFNVMTIEGFHWGPDYNIYKIRDRMNMRRKP